MPLFYSSVPSPVGSLKLVASDHALVAVLWPDDNPKRVSLGPLIAAPDHPLLLQTQHELEQYFARQRTTFSIPLEPRGTRFQIDVWRALLTIPFGETRSYRDLAVQLGNPTATRAVGAANGRNPLSIIVPCHRVIGSSGKLTGFAGGLHVKAQLLALEAPVLA